MTAVASAQPTNSRFTIADGMLHIGGLPVRLRAERADATPFFAYQRTGLTRRIEELRRALPDDIHLSDAVRANPIPAVVQYFTRQVDGFAVLSAGEMTVALDMPIPANRVNFAGPGKTPAELSRAAAPRVANRLESETERLTPACRDRRPCARLSGRRLADDGQSHSVPQPSDTGGAVGVNRRPGLHDR